MSSLDFPPLVTTSNAIFSPADLQGGWIVLYFYPKDATPACTTEGQDFRDAYADFVSLGVKVFGVSRDSVGSHERFKEKQAFPFELISDTEEVLCRVFDVIREKNMYGRKVMGIERSTFVMSPTGEIVAEWRKVKVKGHVEAVLEKVRELVG